MQLESAAAAAGGQSLLCSQSLLGAQAIARVRHGVCLHMCVSPCTCVGVQLQLELQQRMCSVVCVCVCCSAVLQWAAAWVGSSGPCSRSTAAVALARL